ncbi:MAG: sulfite dehydrogenase [Candidatus Solibacter usitatus]|nr:sulfite dehydrogenase [Candidatus Solibacter usitatus]
MENSKQPTGRRWFLRAGAALGGALTACKTTITLGPTAPGDEGPSRLGKPVSAYGERSAFEKAARWSRTTKTPETASSNTPLQDTYGILTPASLHFERHHAGVPAIDPAKHRLLIHGLVERPLIFTVEELKRLPSVSRVHFLECAGNSSGEWGDKTGPDAQKSHGLASCSEWTGVRLALLLQEAGIQSKATWLLAEGADACKMSRSIPVRKAMDDVLVAWGQNGEPIRPEQGYPLRLVVPGWEGNINVKWLHRIKAVDQPHMTKDETSKYTDLMPDGMARIFTFEMDAKSVITSPSGGQKLGGKGFHEISGLAWSGRGRIEKVEVSVDGGRDWRPAALQEPRHRMAFTRFRLPWTWDGQEATLASRATDETGYVQPSKEALIAARGMNSNYHHNGIKAWRVLADGSVRNV